MRVILWTEILLPVYFEEMRCNCVWGFKNHTSVAIYKFKEEYNSLSVASQ